MKWLADNKDKIYYGVLVLFFIIAIYYSFKGYFFFRDTPAVKDGNDLIGRIFSPFVLAILRFVIVMLFGIFIAMNFIANPLKRIKVMQFEVEFSEVAKVQETQLNQFHFLSFMLKKTEFFCGKVEGSSEIPYLPTVQNIFTEYEQFFDQELSIHITTGVYEYDGENTYYSSPEHKRLVKSLLSETDPEKWFRIRKKTFGEMNLLIGIREQYGSKYIAVLESKEHTFTDYDVEVLKSIFEHSKVICDMSILVD